MGCEFFLFFRATRNQSGGAAGCTIYLYIPLRCFGFAIWIKRMFKVTLYIDGEVSWSCAGYIWWPRKGFEVIALSV